MKKDFWIIALVLLAFLALIFFQRQNKSLNINFDHDLTSKLEILNDKFLDKKEGVILLGDNSRIYSPHMELEELSKSFIVELKDQKGFNFLIQKQNSVDKNIVFEIDTIRNKNRLVISIDKIVYVEASNKENIKRGMEILLQVSDTLENKLAFPRFYYAD